MGVNEIIHKRLIKAAKPFLPGMIDTLLAFLQDFKQSIPLEEGETHVGGILLEEYGQFFIVVCAFKDNLVTRKIKVIKQSEILNLVNNGILNS